MARQARPLRWSNAVKLSVGLAATLAAIFSMSQASVANAAEAPRWALSAVTTPTHIEAETPRNEVQKLTVNATGGTFKLEVQPSGVELRITEALPYNATAAEVQSTIANINGVGAGGVSVTGGPGTGTPQEYTIVFEGRQGDRPITLIRTDSSALTGGTATVSELKQGVRPSQLIITATNIGGAATSESAIALTDALPSWLSAVKAVGYDQMVAGIGFSSFGGEAGNMACKVAPTVSCTYKGKVDPGDQLIVFVELIAGAAPPPGAVNKVAIEGGGAPEASVEAALQPDSTPVAFGPAAGSVLGAISTNRAGAHPNFVTSFMMNTKETYVPAGGDPKDIRFDLPPGLVGSTVGMPKCNIHLVTLLGFSGVFCPADTIVGSASILIRGEGDNAPAETYISPVYNIEPAPGEPAAFGFDAIIYSVRLDTTVLSNGNYGVRVTAPHLSEARNVLGSTVTVWGVPAQHNAPGVEGYQGYVSWGAPNPDEAQAPLLTNPQQCQEPLVTTMSADPWREPGAFSSESVSTGALSGCLLVPFGSSFSFLPDTLEAGAPAGYDFELHVQQQNTAGTLASSSVKEVALKLPEGVVVNPSAAWGLRACSSAEFYGPDHPSQEPAAPEECPREAKIGEVEVETPDLEHTLKGDVFLGTPECDPCSPADAEGGRMVRLFIQLVGEGESGIVVKLEGHGLIDQASGRIMAVFKETPQVPFNRMRFVLEGGPRAVLANPRKCGPVKSTGDLTPWSSLLAPGEAGLVGDSLPSYEFEITQNCFGPQFNPSFVAGSPNIQSGAYTPFTLSFGRSDDDEFLGGIKQTMPPGLLGNLSSIPLCKEAEAAQGTCGAGSLIGHVRVLTGPGADPFLVSGGQVFLTEGYERAPYGLSIVVPAVAGPYTLSGTTGKGTVVVRAKIEVDPIDAHLTVTSDPLPTVLDGIPLQLQTVNVTIDKPGFTFNPTSCAKMNIGAVLSSGEGMSASKSSSFQVTNCASLAFKPTFKVSTAAKTSRTNGASLHVQLTYPSGSLGSEANIGLVKVELPKQLPSRLSTLQKACTAAQFNANPAGCAAASIVGHAKATTPIIPVPLEGPAYFVSHGGEAFPSLIVVLQGYGVSVDLVGTTFISKQGITSSTFKTVPDVPVGSFELTLPEGPYSALTNAGSLCKGTLTMPTTLQAQNGMVINQATKIAVTGCPKTKKVTHKKHKATHKRKKGQVKGRKAAARHESRRGRG